MEASYTLRMTLECHCHIFTWHIFQKISPPAVYEGSKLQTKNDCISAILIISYVCKAIFQKVFPPAVYEGSAIYTLKMTRSGTSK